MRQDIQDFIDYLHDKNQTSLNTQHSYRRDLLKMSDYLDSQGVSDVDDVDPKVLHSYIVYLENEGKKPATISRNIASIKAFYHYLELEKKVLSDPCVELKAPHIERKIPLILSDEEMRKVLEQPDENSAKGLRDKAMLELIWSTGLRITETVSLKLSDIDMENDCVTCTDSRSKREIPFSKDAHDALEKYLSEGRSKLSKSSDTELLFMNCAGAALSRQGFWKVMRGYGRQAGIEHEITPHMLRHSCAARMIGNGTDIKAVQNALGHSDVSTTQIYTKLF
jgi:integrase/recombinase XerD